MNCLWAFPGPLCLAVDSGCRFLHEAPSSVAVRVDESEPGAARPVLASTGKRDEEILAPRDVDVLKPVQGRPECFVPLAPERQRDLVVKDFGLGVPPMEPQEVVGRHPFGTNVGRMFQVEKWAFVVAAPQRPPTTSWNAMASQNQVSPSGTRLSSQANSTRRSVTITAPRCAPTISSGSS